MQFVTTSCTFFAMLLENWMHLIGNDWKQMFASMFFFSFLPCKNGWNHTSLSRPGWHCNNRPKKKFLTSSRGRKIIGFGQKIPTRVRASRSWFLLYMRPWKIGLKFYWMWSRCQISGKILCTIWQHNILICKLAPMSWISMKKTEREREMALLLYTSTSLESHWLVVFWCSNSVYLKKSPPQPMFEI